MLLLSRTALAVALLAAAPLALAATDDAKFKVSIKISNACEITATDMVFPDSNTLDNDITATSTVSVDCTNAGPIAVSFNKGESTAATLAARQMRDVNGNAINYSLYRDSAHTQLLGDGLNESSVTINATSTGAADSFTVYGLVPQGQGPKPVGDYADNITATVSF